MFSSICYFLSHMQGSQEIRKVVWNSHLLGIFHSLSWHTVKGFGIVDVVQVDFFWNSLAFSMIQLMLAI